MSDEAHLPAEQSRAQAPARLPAPDGDRRRPQGHCRAPQPRPQETVSLTQAGNGLITSKIEKLRRRAEFLAANGALRAPTTGFVLLVRPRGDGDPAMRLGLTVSKKVGNAVVRNRMKRRFRELARAILPEAGVAGADHVLIGRAGGIERPWAELVEDFTKALRKLRGKAVRPEPVEGLPSLSNGEQERASTGSARTGGGSLS
jgi:ribonuclease P protein component